MSEKGQDAAHAAGGHSAEKKDHGNKMGFVRKLLSLVTISSLLPFAGDLAMSLSLNPMKNSVTTAMGFLKGGGGGHGGGGGTHY